MTGQYLERPTVIPAGELFLEGLFHRGTRAPAALIVAPRTEGGSPMEVPIVAELAWAMHRAQRATLRFNPRGFGASQGAPGEASLVDGLAALQSLRESVEHGLSVAVLGVQSGAALALDIARAEGALAALVVLDPPSALAPALEATPCPLCVLLSEHAEWPWPRGRAGTRRVEEIAGTDAQFLRGLPLFGHAITEYLDALS